MLQIFFGGLTSIRCNTRPEWMIRNLVSGMKISVSTAKIWRSRFLTQETDLKMWNHSRHQSWKRFFRCWDWINPTSVGLLSYQLLYPFKNLFRDHFDLILLYRWDGGQNTLEKFFENRIWDQKVPFLHTFSLNSGQTKHIVDDIAWVTNSGITNMIKIKISMIMPPILIRGLKMA